MLKAYKTLLMNSILSFLKSEETNTHPNTRVIYNTNQRRPESNNNPPNKQTFLCNIIVKLYRIKNTYRRLWARYRMLHIKTNPQESYQISKQKV